MYVLTRIVGKCKRINTINKRVEKHFDNTDECVKRNALKAFSMIMNDIAEHSYRECTSFKYNDVVCEMEIKTDDNGMKYYTVTFWLDEEFTSHCKSCYNARLFKEICIDKTYTTDNTTETTSNNETTESDTTDTKDTESDTTEDTTDTTDNINNVLESIGNKQLIRTYVDGINNGLQNDSYKQARECFEKVVQILPDGYEICFTTKFNIDMTKVDVPIYNHRFKIIRDKTGLIFTIHKYSEAYHEFKPMLAGTEISDIIRYIYYRTFDSVCRVFKRE